MLCKLNNQEDEGILPSFLFMVTINGLKWKIKFTDKEHDLIVNGVVRLGVADRNRLTIYLFDGLYGKMLRKVLIHELTHAWLFSYDYVLDVDTEEMLCAFVDTYAEDILHYADVYLSENKGVKNF